jgi:hypothetical protein
VIARTCNGIANFSAELHDRLVHLRLDLLFERDFSAFEDFMNVRTEFARLGINDCELLFDPKSECMLLHAMERQECRSKTIHCHPGQVEECDSNMQSNKSLNDLLLLK